MSPSRNTMTEQKAGRRPYEITPEILKQVEELAALGRNDKNICLHLGWNPATLYRKKKLSCEFCEAIKKGKERGIAAVTKHLYKQSTEGNPASTIFYLKNRDRENWTDKPQSFPKWTYDKTAPYDDQVSQIMEAASQGAMAADVAATLVSALSASLKVEEQTILRREFEELKRKIDVPGTTETDTGNEPTANSEKPA